MTKRLDLEKATVNKWKHELNEKDGNKIKVDKLIKSEVVMLWFNAINAKAIVL